MLIKVTNKCSMGCNHCMEDSTPREGQHMTRATFELALDATERMEALVARAGLPVFALLSGGECTEHPDVVWMVGETLRRGFHVVLVTNGLWLDDPELRAALLRPEWRSPRYSIQVTNDPRFYPWAPSDVPAADDRVVFVGQLNHLIALGRAAKRPDVMGLLPEKGAPGSFNFRSFVRSTGSLEEAILRMRVMALAGRSGWCSPNIDSEGIVRAGETRSCWPVGDVTSPDFSPARVRAATLAMGTCDRCGLEGKLDQAHRRAIGLTTLFLGTEP